MEIIQENLFHGMVIYNNEVQALFDPEELNIMTDSKYLGYNMNNVTPFRLQLLKELRLSKWRYGSIEYLENYIKNRD